MELTYNQKKQLFENGYVKIEGVVPRVLTERALQQINHSLGEGLPPGDLNTLRAQSYCPELTRSSFIMDLLHKTPAIDLVGSIIDLNQIHSIAHGQVALRFPGEGSRPVEAKPHVDGVPSPHNGVTAGAISNFTALVGILLSDLPGGNAGNFTVWPGTHTLYEAYFREHGPESLLNGLPPVAMPEPVQITGKAGDIVIVHYMLAHGVTPNISPHIRYACFYRVKHKHIQPDNWKESMTNMWMHWPGLQEMT
jgi:ectoine hydroxylase-related dioxygenase (phytanoyl-CoA dioxygenase family)